MKNFLKTIFATFIGATLALTIGILLIISIFSSIAAIGSTETADAPTSAVLSLDFSSTVAEQGSKDDLGLGAIIPANPFGLAMSGDQIGIYQYVTAIEKAATDPAIKYIFINTSKLQTAPISISHCEEIRAALVRFRSSGKPIIAYAENFSQNGYYLASVADKVYMDPMGMNDIVGISANIMFLKDILDKLGVEVQLIRHGKYKSAGEQFIASDISTANYEQNYSTISSLWESISADICQSRDLSVEKLNSLVNNLEISNPQDLVNAGLVDKLLHKDEMEAELCSLYDVEDLEDLNLVSIDKYAEAVIKPNVRAKSKIAVVYAGGNIVSEGLDGTLSAKKYRKILQDIRKDSTIKAVVLRVDSPGGSASAADIIRRELNLIQEDKPIIVSFANYAASGGYWISAECDKVFTNRTTLTGSIGVFSMVPNLEKVFKETLKINPVSITTHKHSDMMNLRRPLDQQETNYFQSGVELVYDQFISIVAKGRELSKEEVDEIAQGRVWTGSQAVEINLADELGGIYEAINYAISSLGEENYQLVEYPKVQSSMDAMMESFKNTAAISQINTPEELLKSLNTFVKQEKGILARMPYTFEFNQ